MSDTRIVILALLLCFTAGCMPVSNEKREALLDKEPAFRQALQEKKQAEERIRLLKSELRDKKNLINSKIDVLKKEYKGEKSRIEAEIRELSHRMDPEVTVLTDERNLIRQDIKEKRVEIRGIEKTVRDLRKLISKEDRLDISNEEIDRWHKRIKSLEEDEREIRRSLRELSEELETLETKLKLLR